MGSKFRLGMRNVDGVVILDTDGYIDSDAAAQISKLCQSQIEEGNKKFLLNLEKTPIVNSIGVSTILEIIEKLQKIDGRIGHCCLAPIVEKTFKIMGVVKYSEVYGSEEEALKEMG